MVLNDDKIYELDDLSLRNQSYTCFYKRKDGIKFGPLHKIDEIKIEKQDLDIMSQCSDCNIGMYNKKC